MAETWSELLDFRYGALTQEEICAAWESARQTFHLGQWIVGEVVAVAPFGTWIDFGISIPGVLLIPRFRPALKPVGEADPPTTGDSLRCRLLSFNYEAKQLVLSQDPEEEPF